MSLHLESTMVSGSTDRDQVAELLHRARNERSSRKSKLIDRAHAILPDSRFVQRLKIEFLLAQGKFREADRLLSKGLLQRPSNPALIQLQALSLLRQGDPTTAQREIRIALRQRPRHIGTLKLAAQIARELHDHEEAIKLLDVAQQIQPEDESLFEPLLDSLINARKLEWAETQLRDHPKPPIKWIAKVLIARGQKLQAITLLDAHLARPRAENEQDVLLAQLIECLEDQGHRTRERKIMSQLNSTHPESLIRASESNLAKGRFKQAISLLNRMPVRDRMGGRAIAIRQVALAFCRPSETQHSGKRDQMSFKSNLSMAQQGKFWRRGLLGELLHCQSTVDPSRPESGPGQLKTLLRHSLEVFDRAGQDLESHISQMELADHAAFCEDALGQYEAQEAHSALGV
ncbi:MAG: hypothetical protein O7G85_15825 [Planctomycetota bacterium]|nr:hypothetical protein [Planctomycetota bacterium]